MKVEIGSSFELYADLIGTRYMVTFHDEKYNAEVRPK